MLWDLSGPDAPWSLRIVALLLDGWIKGALIILLAGLAVMTLRRASAATRHAVWFLALIGTAAVPIVSVLLPTWQLQTLPHSNRMRTSL